MKKYPFLTLEIHVYGKAIVILVIALVIYSILWYSFRKLTDEER